MKYFQNKPKLGHITTFGGNPVIAAASLATLRVLRDSNLISQIEKKEALFRKELKHHQIKEIRGKGLRLCVEIDPNYVSVKELSKMCLEAGILCKETHETTFRYAPPLVISKEELDWGIEKIKAVFSKITS